MGITGLLPFLKTIQKDVHVSYFRGKRVAVDAYGWLHRGAYSCATQLVMKTEKLESLPFIRYCMKRVNLLRQYDITPIIVFDGGDLPTKSHTEKERREKRQFYLQKGKALLKEGKRSEAFDCFQKSVDVSPEMALAFIKECRRTGVECIVAPYEADAQLTYLQKEGIVDFVITEDSDMLVFGSERVLFKMDEGGNGKLINLEDLGKANKTLIGFTQDSFRQMCILSGCDYLPSIPGVGLGRASKLMRKFNQNPFRVIKSLQYETGKVPQNYEENFKKAEYTFLYQLVFDPRTQKQVRLNELPEDLDPKEFEFAGVESSPRKAVGMARGNINPITHEVMDTYSPSKAPPPKSTSWSASAMGGTNRQFPVAIQAKMSVSSSEGTKKQFKPPKKAVVEDASLKDEDLQSFYSCSSLPEKPRLEDIETQVPELDTPQSGVSRTHLLSSDSQSSQKTKQNMMVVSRFFAPKVNDNESEYTPVEEPLRLGRKLRIGHSAEEEEKDGDEVLGSGRIEEHSSLERLESLPESGYGSCGLTCDSIPESPTESQVSHSTLRHSDSLNPAKKRLQFSRFSYSEIKKPRLEPSDPITMLDRPQSTTTGGSNPLPSPARNPFSVTRASPGNPSRFAYAKSQLPNSGITDSFDEPSTSKIQSVPDGSRTFDRVTSMDDSANPSSCDSADLVYDSQQQLQVDTESDFGIDSQYNQSSTIHEATSSELARRNSFMTSEDFITNAASPKEPRDTDNQSVNSQQTDTSDVVDLTNDTLVPIQNTPRQPSMLFNKIMSSQKSSSKRKGIKIGLAKPGSNSRFKPPRRSSESGLKQMSLLDTLAPFTYKKRPQMST